MKKKELSLLDKLVEKVETLKPSEFKYVKDTSQGGSKHKYITSQGDYKIILKGWIAWDDSSEKENPSHYELNVWDKRNDNLILYFSDSCDINKKRKESILNLYQKVCKKVSKYEIQQIKVKKRKALKKLEEFLK